MWIIPYSDVIKSVETKVTLPLEWNMCTRPTFKPLNLLINKNN